MGLYRRPRSVRTSVQAALIALVLIATLLLPVFAMETPDDNDIDEEEIEEVGENPDESDDDNGFFEGDGDQANQKGPDDEGNTSETDDNEEISDEDDESLEEDSEEFLVFTGIRAEDISVEWGDEDFGLLDGVQARDSDGGAIEEIEVADDGGFDVFVVGDYDITYSAEDPLSGERMEGRRTVSVEAPELTLFGGVVPNAADASASSSGELNTAIGAAPTDGTTWTIEITGDISMGTLTIPTDKDIVLVSDGAGPWTLTQTGGYDAKHFNVYGELTISDLTLDGNGDGSGVRVYSGGIFHMLDDTVIENGNTSNGVVWADGGTFNMSGGVIRNNQSTVNSGGVYISSGGTFNMSGGAISGNRGARSGGVYNDGGTFHMSGGAIRSNTHTSTVIANKGGGGVHNSGTFTMTGGVIGGDSEADGNTAGFGGGLYTSSGGTAEISGDALIKNNVASATNSTNNGGGISSEGRLELSGSAKIVNNKSKKGGGVYLSDSATLAVSDGVEISGNEAEGSEGGGGIYVGVGHTNDALTMTGGTISANKAPNGGGVRVANGKVSLTGGSISNNTASTSGGGLYINNSCEVQIADTTISSNTATDFYGGGIYNGGNTTLSGGATISDNSARDGGGVNNTSSAIFRMTGGTIRNNRASSTGHGGGGVCNNGTFYLYSGAISDNTSGGTGGGMSSLGTVYLSGGKISDNTAITWGGGIYNTGNSAELYMSSGAEISGNTAARGGGVANSGMVDNAQFQMSGGTISSNTGTVSGGGIYTYDYTNLKITGGAFSGNTASFGYTFNAADTATYEAQVSGITSLSLPFDIGSPDGRINKAYNNYDINYTNGTVYKIVTVSFNAQSGGDVTDPADIQVQYGSTYGPLPDLTSARPGYHFDGWYTAPVGGTEVKADTTVASDTNHTLHARWTQITHEVTFNANGGTLAAGTVSPRQVAEGATVPEPGDPVRQGHTFTG